MSAGRKIKVINVDIENLGNLSAKERELLQEFIHRHEAYRTNGRKKDNVFYPYLTKTAVERLNPRLRLPVEKEYDYDLGNCTFKFRFKHQLVRDSKKNSPNNPNNPVGREYLVFNPAKKPLGGGTFKLAVPLSGKTIHGKKTMVFISDKSTSGIKRALLIEPISQNNKTEYTYHIKDMEKENELAKEALDNVNRIAYGKTYEETESTKGTAYTSVPRGRKKLTSILAKRNQLSIAERILLFSNLLQALEDLHNKRIIHRDIKPDNIMVDERTMEVMIVDFGFSSKTNAKPGTVRTKCGTPDWRAPETYSPDHDYQNEQCDDFAMGLIGRELFDDITRLQEIYNEKEIEEEEENGYFKVKRLAEYENNTPPRPIYFHSITTKEMEKAGVDINKLEVLLIELNRSRTEGRSLLKEALANLGIITSNLTKKTKKEIEEIKQRAIKPKFNFFRDEPIIAGIVIGLAVILVAAIVAAVIFSNGLAALPIAAASATIGTFITAITGASISAAAISVIGAAVIGVGLAAAGAALGAVGGFIAFIKNKFSNKEMKLDEPEKAKSSNTKIKLGEPEKTQSSNKEIKLNEPEKAIKLSDHSIFKKNNLSQKSYEKSDDIQNVISFLGNYIEYFTAPFKNRVMFDKWLKTTAKTTNREFPVELTKIFTVKNSTGKPIVNGLPFKEAIYGEIVSGNKESIEHLLEKRTDLLDLLNRHRINADTIKHIDQWYEDHGLTKKMQVQALRFSI